MIIIYDILRFAVTWFGISALVVMLDTCPECGAHHLGHGNYTPILAGFVGAVFFQVMRYVSRFRKSVDTGNAASGDDVKSS